MKIETFFRGRSQLTLIGIVRKIFFENKIASQILKDLCRADVRMCINYKYTQTKGHQSRLVRNALLCRFRLTLIEVIH